MLARLDRRGVPDPAADLPRPMLDSAGPVEAVREILADVAERGDTALRELTARFDGVELADLRVSETDLDRAFQACERPLHAALEAAAESIRAFHQSELTEPHTYARDGIEVRCETSPVARAGLYVPGGLGAYPSTVLMTAVPAKVAGVDSVALCTPPDRKTGEVSPAVAAAAVIAGIDEVYAVGGAQAIGAMAFGTASIAATDVIVGPGNAYVALAKREVAGVVGIPSAFAGPSEVVVIADETADPRFVAIDVIVQAEHGPDGLAWLITWSPELADSVLAEIAAYVAESPRRGDIEATFDQGGYAVLVDGPDEALAVSDAIAPEHLEIICADSGAMARRAVNAGAVFSGPWAPASVGDYVAGPSHVLPTAGTARFSSVLGVSDFQRRQHVVSLTPDAIRRVGPMVETLATAEGFDAHAESVRRRLAALDGLGDDSGAGR